MFAGNDVDLRFVSSYSLAEGARGYPRAIEYRILPDPKGGLHLMISETVYTGACISDAPSAEVEVARRLGSARYLYRDPLPDSPWLGGAWLASWSKINLPRAVRIEIVPLDVVSTRLPLLTLNVPIRVTREVASPYADQQ